MQTLFATYDPAIHQRYPDSLVIFVMFVGVLMVIGAVWVVYVVVHWFIRGLLGLSGPGQKPEPVSTSLPVIQAPLPIIPPPQESPSLWFQPPVVRPIELEDIEVGYKQALEVFGPVKQRDLKTAYLVWNKQKNGTVIFVATVGDKVVGTATIVFDAKPYHDGRPVGFIEDVAVLPEFRRIKVGTKLIEACVAAAKERNAYKIVLDSLKDAVQFYTKLGFYHAPTVNMRMDIPASEGTPMEVTT